jgi:hypothetical protein
MRGEENGKENEETVGKKAGEEADLAGLGSRPRLSLTDFECT